MFAAQRAKFATPEVKSALLKTEEAFLLAHNGVEGDDTNCLGLQLMLLRDEFTGKSEWTRYISAHIDLRTGKPKSNVGMEEWRTTVQSASRQLVNILTIRHMISPRAGTLVGGSVQAPASSLNTSVLISQPAEISQPVESSRAFSERVHKGAAEVCAPEVAESRPALQPTQVKRAVVSTASSEKAPVLHLRLPVAATAPSRKRVRFEDEVESWVEKCAFSNLLSVQPDNEIRFARSATSTTVMLENISGRNVAFKFKASTHSCLARPMSGTIQPGERQEVLLSLNPVFGQGAVREKYLVQAMQVQSPAVLSREEWVAMGKGSVCELRLPALRDAA